MKNEYYVLKKITLVDYYEDGSNSYESIEAIGSSEKELFDLWNSYVQRQLDEVSHLDKSYSNLLPNLMKEGELKSKKNYSGGGCSFY